MRNTIAAVLTVSLSAAMSTAQRDVPEVSNLLTQFLDRADIHPPTRVERLTVFAITLSRPVERMERVLTMQQALDRGLLAIEEMASARVSEARFINKSRDRMIFLMAGELVTGGKQNRSLATDALLGPGSSEVLPLYCVEKHRWKGDVHFRGAASIAPQAIRAKAGSGAGQEEIWEEVGRANKRLEAESATEDLATAMQKPENVRRLNDLRRKIVPDLPRDCVGVVVAVGRQIVGADLFNSPELFGDLRDKVLDSYLSEYGWPLPVRRRPIVPVGAVTAEEIREYLRDCYRSRFAPGERRGVGRIYHLRGQRSGHTLGYNERHMVHTSLVSPRILPVRPHPVPRPLPEPMPRR